MEANISQHLANSEKTHIGKRHLYIQYLKNLGIYSIVPDFLGAPCSCGSLHESHLIATFVRHKERPAEEGAATLDLLQSLGVE